MFINVYEMNTYHTGPSQHETEEECVKAILLAPSAYKFTLVRNRSGEWLEVDLSNQAYKTNVEINPMKKAHLIKHMILSVMLLSFLTACMGRGANPVQTRQVDDSSMTCEQIRTELYDIQEDVQKLLPKSDKTAKNVGLGIAGLFLIVPWFFMDLSSAEQQEIQAYQVRANHLERIASDKKCKI